MVLKVVFSIDFNRMLTVLLLIALTCFENGLATARYVNISVYEMDNVTLECSTESEMKQSVDWSVTSAFQRKLTMTTGYQYPRRIYTNCDVIVPFEVTGRYNVTRPRSCENTNSELKIRNYYNMTIARLNLSETGEYKCREMDGVGSTLSVYSIHVLVNLSTIKAEDTKYVNATIGENMTLVCHGIAKDLRWIYIDSNDGTQQTMVQDNSVMDSFTDKVIFDQSSLHLYNVQFSDTGSYVCIDYGISHFKLHYRLVFPADFDNRMKQEPNNSSALLHLLWLGVFIIIIIIVIVLFRKKMCFKQDSNGYKQTTSSDIKLPEEGKPLNSITETRNAMGEDSDELVQEGHVVGPPSEMTPGNLSIPVTAVTAPSNGVTVDVETNTAIYGPSNTASHPGASSSADPSNTASSTSSASNRTPERLQAPIQETINQGTESNDESGGHQVPDCWKNMDWKKINWRNNIRANFSCLLLDIDTGFEFEGSMKSNNVLRPLTMRNIWDHKDYATRVDMLLDQISKGDDDRFLKFCQALEDSDQKHIIYSYFAKISRSSSGTATAPCPHEKFLSDAILAQLRKNWNDIMCGLDSSLTGLLMSGLDKYGVFTKQHIKRLKEIDVDMKRNREILCLLEKTSDLKYQRFCQVLHECEQNQVLELLYNTYQPSVALASGEDEICGKIYVQPAIEQASSPQRSVTDPEMTSSQGTSSKDPAESTVS